MARLRNELGRKDIALTNLQLSPSVQTGANLSRIEPLTNDRTPLTFVSQCTGPPILARDSRGKSVCSFILSYSPENRDETR